MMCPIFLGGFWDKKTEQVLQQGTYFDEQRIKFSKISKTTQKYF